jgi:ubiquinone/menaquinone biosynthesis C-methylase UbiE
MDSSEVRAFFDDVASDWDTMRLSYYDERVIDQLAERTELDGTRTVVDVGTGTGFVAAGLASRASRVVAMDNSPGMLDVARENLERLDIDNVELVQADLAALPLPGDAVDAAVANMVLHHAQDPAAMVGEMTPRHAARWLGGHHRRGRAPVRVDARRAR